jgi:hypothetical protein
LGGNGCVVTTGFTPTAGRAVHPLEENVLIDMICLINQDIESLNALVSGLFKGEAWSFWYDGSTDASISERGDSPWGKIWNEFCA